jgi:hypothetical protein
MGEVQYKGWEIEPQSYQSDGDRWRPSGRLYTHPVSAPLDVMFDTEQDADAYAVKMAKKWIDERG